MKIRVFGWSTPSGGRSFHGRRMSDMHSSSIGAKGDAGVSRHIEFSKAAKGESAAQGVREASGGEPAAAPPWTRQADTLVIKGREIPPGGEPKRSAGLSVQQRAERLAQRWNLGEGGGAEASAIPAGGALVGARSGIKLNAGSAGARDGPGSAGPRSRPGSAGKSKPGSAEKRQAQVSAGEPPPRAHENQGRHLGWRNREAPPHDGVGRPGDGGHPGGIGRTRGERPPGSPASPPSMTQPIDSTAPTEDSTSTGAAQDVPVTFAFNAGSLDKADVTSTDGPSAADAVTAAITAINAAAGRTLINPVLAATETDTPADDGVNVISFAPSNYRFGDSETIAETTSYLKDEREIVGSDILLNPKMAFSTDASGQTEQETLDLQGIVTHELLHALGMQHNNEDSSSVMRPATSATDDTEQRTLDAQDITNLQALYPEVT